MYCAGGVMAGVVGGSIEFWSGVLSSAGVSSSVGTFSSGGVSSSRGTLCSSGVLSSGVVCGSGACADNLTGARAIAASRDAKTRKRYGNVIRPVIKATLARIQTGNFDAGIQS